MWETYLNTLGDGVAVGFCFQNSVKEKTKQNQKNTGTYI